MISFFKAYWLPLAIVALFLLASACAFKAGQNYNDRAWGKKWADHLLEDSQATASYQAEQRQIEQDRQRKIDQVTTNAQTKIDQAYADAAFSDGRSIGVQQRADAISAELERSQASLGACATAASQAATKAAGVLADVLKRADQRAGILAGVADQAIERGLSCEAAYGSIL